MVDEVVVGLEDAVGEPVVAHELPDVFLGIEFWAFRRQRHEGEVGRNGEPARGVPAGLVEENDGMAARCHLAGDFGEMEAHGLAVAAGQHEACAFALTWADGTEEIGGLGALVLWC